MPQICAWFPDATFKFIADAADKDSTTKSKMVVRLVEQALHTHETEQTLAQKDEQLGMALHNLSQLQNEIIPPLKLLIEGENSKGGRFAWLFKR